MARPATGSPRWNKTSKAWEVRVTLTDGSRSRPVTMTGLPACTVRPDDPERGCPCASCVLARDSAGKVSKRMRKGAAVDAATSETCDEWYERAHAYAVELGHTDAVKKRSRWVKWISPRIGHKSPHEVTRDNIEDIRDDLDAAIAAWKRDGANKATITGKTAMNVWSCLTSSFKAMISSKRRDLRALDGRPNPCVGVEPPGDRDSRKPRRKTFLYPKEASALLGCDAIDLEWRVLYALALYTYLRPGELRVLTWSDVDLEAGLIQVTKAWDYEDEKVKPPKTRNGVRRVPIDPALAPLLKELRKSKEPGDVVTGLLALYGEKHLAHRFRAHLLAADVRRNELHVSTRTHVQANFRSCRDTGITWLAMSGLGVDKIMRRAGHDDIATSMGYVKLAEDLTGDLGVPFGPLPSSLLGFRSNSGVLVENTPKTSEIQWAQRDLKPCVSAQDLSTDDAREPEKTEAVAIADSPAQSPVLAAGVDSESPRIDPDEALKAAIRAAVDAGNFERAKALIAVLEAAPRPAPVLPIRAVK